MINRERIREQCATSYGKNVRLKHLQRCLSKKKFRKAIEIGCGPAWLLHNVHADKKVGYDLEPIDVFEDIKYVKKGLEDLGKDSADLLICSEVIEHIEDDQAALHKLYNLVKEKGFIFLTTTNRNTKIDKSEQDKQRGHLRRYSKDLKRMIEQSGFKTLNFYPAKSQHYYLNKGNISSYSCDVDIFEANKEASAWIYFGMKEEIR